jgi:hypothetical protein
MFYDTDVLILRTRLLKRQRCFDGQTPGPWWSPSAWLQETRIAPARCKIPSRQGSAAKEIFNRHPMMVAVLAVPQNTAVINERQQ